MNSRSRCAELLLRQKLSRKPSPISALELMEHECGIQSQIFIHSLLAIHCRTQHTVEPNDIKNLIENDKRILRTWTLRGTLHLIHTADAALMWSAFSNEWFTRWGSYLNKHVTEYQKESVADAILNLLVDGPKTRENLKEELKKSLKLEHHLIDYLLSSWGGILKDLSYKRMVIHGHSSHNEIHFYLTSSWLKGQPDVSKKYDQEEALGILLLRYLKAYGPSRIEDFAYWSGITLTMAKKIFRHMKAELVSINDLYDTKNMYTETAYELEQDEATDKVAEHIPAVKLLPKFDPFLLGHKDKFYLDKAHYKKIFSGAGNINAPVLIEGNVVGAWKLRGKKVNVGLFEEVNESFQAELHQEVKQIESFFNVQDD